jgi:hypothetical protein
MVSLRPETARDCPKLYARLAASASHEGDGTMNDDTTTVDYFGGCPTCGKNDGYLNAGRTHVFYCREHKVSWIFGANMFSSWKDETEEEQREKYKLIEDFERVEPLWPDDAHVVGAARVEDAGLGADDDLPF